MGYVDESLIPGEEIIVRARLHWAALVYYGAIAALGLLIAILLSVSGDSTLTCFGWFVFLLFGLQGVGSALVYFTTEFALTTKRVIAKKGLIRRHSLELVLGKIESIRVKQPIMGRLFNYGTIVVTGSGGTKEDFPNIASPMELRKAINTQLAQIS